MDGTDNYVCPNCEDVVTDDMGGECPCGYGFCRRAGGWRPKRRCWAWPSMEAAQAAADRLNAEQAAAIARWKRNYGSEAA